MCKNIDPKEIETQFLELREKLIKESEEEFYSINNMYDYPDDWPKIAPNNIILSKLGLTNQKLEELDAELDKSDEKIVQHYIENVRSNLVKGPYTPNEALRQQTHFPESIPDEMKMARLYNATIVTDDVENLKNMQGKVHNPWIDPTNAEFQDMLVRYSGSGGWGCRRRDEHRGSFDCHWTYSFTTGSDLSRRFYRFYGSVEFRGFFSCISNDRPFICRSARIHASLRLRTYQFGSECSRVESTIMNHRGGRGDRINARGRYDGERQIWEPSGVFLHTNTPTFVVVTAHIYARARGRGSYAEINFNDGATNWIRGMPLYYYNSSYGPPR